jgi:psiF repeat
MSGALSLGSKALLTSFCGLMAISLAAAAQDENAARQRLRACHAKADEKALDGRARTKFVNACVGGYTRSAELTPKEQRHEACNDRARGLEGAARRGYMTQCEKAPADARAANASAQERECQRRAGGRRLRGGERRAYIKGCLDAAAADG